jgi:uncharacterized cupredoxin-like copper-binding protein
MSTKIRIRRHGVWLAAGAAIALGVATTAVAAGNGAFHTSTNTPYSAGCQAPAPVGAQVRVSVSDMGGGMMNNGSPTGGGSMMGNGSTWAGMGRMGMAVAPQTVPAGKITLDVVNVGMRDHEVLVLPLAAGAETGQRIVGTDGRIDESSSLGEASKTCGSGAGDGIAAHTSGWVTVTLAPGRYELVCNIPGHYSAGAFAELDVT